MSLVHAMGRRGHCMDDVDVLRAGESGGVLGHRVMAPSTWGTFLRTFTFGHIRQLDAWSEFALTAAWAAGGGPQIRRGDDDRRRSHDLRDPWLRVHARLVRA